MNLESHTVLVGSLRETVDCFLEIFGSLHKIGRTQP